MGDPRIDVVQVDERDSGGEDPGPRFRVYLDGSGETTTTGWTDTYDVTGADLLQVLDWAQRQAGDTLTYAIALVVDVEATESRPNHGRGLVWLVGVDGNTNVHADPVEADAQRRMLARRRQPVGVPAADRVPPGVPDPYDARGASAAVGEAWGRGRHPGPSFIKVCG